MKNVVNRLLAASLVPAAEVAGDQRKAEQEPPQKLAPPTVFTKEYEQREKLAGQEGDNTVAELAQMIDNLAIDAEPALKVATVDLVQSPTPAPPPGTGVPNAAGTTPVDLSTSDSSSTEESSEEELPSADPVAPAATAAAKRAKVGMAGDVTEGREDAHKMEEFE